MDKLTIVKIAVRLAAAVTIAITLKEFAETKTLHVDSSLLVKIAMIGIWIHAEWDWRARRKNSE